MWREDKNNLRPSPGLRNNNRWRLAVAVIFLLAGALLYKLFSVQIKECDLYTALASSQQQVSSQLTPERGEIYLTESLNGQEKLYPLATNKDFAVLYAVPKDVENPPALAEKIYEFFDYPRWLAANRSASSTPPEIATATKEEMIATRLTRLDKPGDLYEPLENKLTTDDLLKFYAFLLSSTSTPVAATDLELQVDKIIDRASSSEEVTIPGLGFTIKNRRYYPENNLAAQLVGFVSYADNEGEGKYGLEEFFNDELFGQYGSLKSEKGAGDNVIIVNDREYVKPLNGSDLILTVDRNIEYVACEKLKAAAGKYDADSGSVIVMDPRTGAILAMCSVPDFDPNAYQDVKDISVFNNPAIFNQYEPGSVFKAVTMSAAIEQGKVTPTTTYEDKGEVLIPGWPKPIKNSDFASHGPHGVVDMNAVLENSLNTGAIFALRQIGPKVFADYVKNYGFGETTGIELGAESSGNIGSLLSDKVKEIDAATASFGQGIAVTALQMLMPYQVIANRGILMKPYVVKVIVHPDGQREDILPQQVHRVISEKTADTMAAMLVNVVEEGHAKGVRISGYYIGGKTGTAQVATPSGYSETDFTHTFVAIAPIDNPVAVMIAKLDNPKGVQFAESTVVPLCKEIADFILKYYQVPKTRT